MRQPADANPDFAPAHPAAVNPVLRKPPRPEGRVWLDDPDAVATVDLAKAICALALRLLAGAYTVPQAHPDKDRRGGAEWFARAKALAPRTADLYDICLARAAFRTPQI
ncbi:hypothetical protein [Sphingopyxis sp. JAI128]|uniref:hypothetical protein n=1 Tax=Sphingopyxis sp. JAI128 TaxID=2723066 RepID=UPI0017A716EC|nr:hypothetical protein [Sphingopyxis sp. JAI128]MBB6426095.1 hypothetical protein [Sphingopyxis sp. JAI128]